ncbi:response regulator [Methanobacterium alkalithermotolerans]|uniref:histidine kinase n=1 Tax=Methanobacterium alkalithermotolerans TaxID=2731220 RepID=A0A8T8K7K0_9EURY|nr:histidine kinase dimerization/phosphoacceptor domain -containing protein [Methanobacterium alkalithermotolerans]QUH22950.1 response regulator [Methanobacterium alkalithermotolerans]
MVNEKILIVEDEELVAQDIKSILEDLGYVVPAISSSAEEALEKIEQNCPDSVLMDIMLEGEMDGIEAAQIIGDRFDIPVVYLTAYSNGDILKRAKKTEPYAYILKPFQEQDLKVNIELALYKHEAKKNKMYFLKQKALNRKLENSLKEKDTLLREIHHRVKNNLQIIVSLLSLQAKYFNDPGINNFFRDYVNQIKSMAMIHEKMYQSNDLNRINFTEYLPGLFSQLSSSYNKHSKVNILFQADEILLNLESAIPCGLIINELVTNSLKHAFPFQRPGKIKIELFRLDDGKICLNIYDNGKGIPPEIEFPQKGSFGFRMVYTLVNQLGGTIKLDKNRGTHFMIIFEELKYNQRIIKREGVN